MSSLKDSHPLSDFQRNAASHIERLKQTRRAEFLTVDGRPEVVVQDAGAYEQLLDDLDHAQAVAGIRRGLASMARDEGRPMREALEDIGRRHGIDVKHK